MKKVNGLEKEENNVREISLGSLFDGIGGFPLAARSSGVFSPAIRIVRRDRV